MQTWGRNKYGAPVASLLGSTRSLNPSAEHNAGGNSLEQEFIAAKNVTKQSKQLTAYLFGTSSLHIS